MASLIIPVSLLIISARGQERNPLRLRPTSLYPPPPTLPRRLSSSISLSRQLQYLLRDATSSTKRLGDHSLAQLSRIITRMRQKKKGTMSIVSQGIFLIFFRTFPFFHDFFFLRNCGCIACPFNRVSLFQRFRAPNFSIHIYIYHCWGYNGNAKRDWQSKFLRVTLALGGFFENSHWNFWTSCCGTGRINV